MRRKISFLLILSLIVVMVGCQQGNKGDKDVKISVSNTVSKRINLMKEFDSFKERVESRDNIQEKEGEIDNLINKIGKWNFPLIQGEDIIFIYRVEREVNEVYFLSELNSWKEKKMKRLADTSLYYLKVKIGEGSRFDYKFLVDGYLKNDPFNLSKGVKEGGTFNSQVAMPGYNHKGYWIESESVEVGKLLDNKVDGVGLSIYLPYKYDSTVNYPVVYFLSGRDYLNYGDIQNTLDNLLADSKVEDFIGVFIEVKEDFYFRKNLSKLLLNKVIPYVDTNYSTLSNAKGRTLVGFDIAANKAVSIVLNNSTVVSNVIAQSPSLNRELANLLANKDLSSINLYLDWGKYNDSKKTSNNIEFVRKLREFGYKHQVQVHPDGNGWGSWREHISDGLEYVFSNTRNVNELEVLEINEKFDSRYIENYFEVDKRKIKVKVKDDKYTFSFREQGFIRVNYAKFKNFNLKLTFSSLNDKSTALLFLGEKNYVLAIDYIKEKFILFEDNVEKYSTAISTLEDINEMTVKSKSGKLEVIINNEFIGEIDFSNEDSKYIAISAEAGSELLLDSLYIKEQF